MARQDTGFDILGLVLSVIFTWLVISPKQVGS